MSKIVDVEIGDRVVARHKGTDPEGWVEGVVIENNADKCVILRDNGLTAMVFGEVGGNAERRWRGAEIIKK